MKCFLFFLCFSSINSNYTPSTGTDDYFIEQEYERSELEKYAEAWANHFQVPLEMVKAVIEQESNWNNKAYSNSGAKGLMQVLESTAKWLGKKPEESLYNPYTNIYYGCKYLQLLLKEYNQNHHKALMAYYGGPHNVAMNPKPSFYKYADSVLKKALSYMEVGKVEKGYL